MADPRNEHIIYEDDSYFAMLHPLPQTAGHIVVVPKQHLPIMEQLSSEQVAHGFMIANKVSSILFDSLPISGTNILVQNGTSAGQEQPHFMIHVIPRVENDGIELQWKPQEATEESLSTAEAKLKQYTRNIGVSKKEEKKVVEHKERVTSISTEEADDYRLRQLRRLP